MVVISPQTRLPFQIFKERSAQRDHHLMIKNHRNNTSQPLRSINILKLNLSPEQAQLKDKPVTLCEKVLHISQIQLEFELANQQE